MKTNTKKYIEIILFFIIIIGIIFLLMFGVQNRREIITYVRFGSFLNYSLGDYTRVEREKKGDAFGHHIVIWTLEYQRVNGESDRITLILRSGSRSNMERHFSNVFIYHGTNMVMDDLLRESVERHFSVTEESRTALIHSIRRHFYIEDYENMGLTVRIGFGERSRSLPLDASRVLDRRNGIQLYSLTPYILFNEWESILEISLYSHNHDVSLNYLQERFEALVRDVSQSYHIPVVKANLRHGETRFIGYYFLETDAFETR